MPYRRASRLVIPVLTAVCLLAGCSDKPADGQQVATLQSTGPATARTGAAEVERPLIGLDTSEREADALWKTWEDCVTKEAKGAYDSPKEVAIKERENDPKAKQIRQTCLPKEPETYEERQKQNDLAAFQDNQRQWYQCAEQAGYKLTAPDENGEFGLTEIGPKGDFRSPGMEKCRKEAFTD